MNFLGRAFLYDLRKRGNSLTLFLLFVLSTLLITISLSVFGAAEAAAANLRQTVGAVFTLRGKPIAFRADDTDAAMQFVPIFPRDVDHIAGHAGIRAFNAQQSATANAGDFIFPSGASAGTICANTSSAWNDDFTSGMLVLSEGRHISPKDRNVALISRDLAKENALAIGSELSFTDPTTTVKIIGIYANAPGTEFDADTIFVDHATVWRLRGDGETYSGRVDFFVTDPARLESVMAQVQQDAPLSWESYSFQADTDAYDAIAGQISSIGRLTTFLVVSAITVSIVVLSLVLAMRTRSRTKEIGILLAVGISKKHILAQFVTETTIVALFAILFSCPVSYVAAARIGTLLQDAVGTGAVEIPTGNLLLQYGIEIGVAIAAVLVTASPLFRLPPKEILANLS